MDTIAIASLIETQDFNQSSVHKYMGSNVKSPGLVKGNWYVIKFWSLKSVKNTDNPYWLGQFIGAGISSDNIFSTTPRAKELKENERYFFKKTSGDVLIASNYLGSLVLNNDPEQRITFYALLSEPLQSALPLQPTARNPVERPAKPAVRPVVRAAANSTPAPVRVRNKTAEDISAEEFSSVLLKMANRVTTRRNFYVAVFKDEMVSTTFMLEYQDSTLEVDGSRHTVSAPHDQNPNSDFFAKAKKYGAVECYNWNSIIN